MDDLPTPERPAEGTLAYGAAIRHLRETRDLSVEELAERASAATQDEPLVDRAIGLEIKSRREGLSLSPEDLAKAAGVEVARIEAFEEGRELTEAPMAELLRICGALGTTFSAVLRAVEADFELRDGED